MSRVIEQIASRYRQSTAGRTGAGCRDLIFGFNDLLKTAGCPHGSERTEALRELEGLESRGLLILERHPRDHSAILKVRLPLRNAPALFDYLGRPSPERQRNALAGIFRSAESSDVPGEIRGDWTKFCRQLALAAETGGSIHPFDRSRPRQIEEIMRALPIILAWKGDSMLRFASATIARDSKFLESVRPRIEACLARITDGTKTSLADFGILENERSFLLHGPAELHFSGGKIQLGLLRSAVRFGAEDLRRATITTSATRCLTVENAAMFHELVKLSSGVLLSSSGSEGGFANSAVIAFLYSLPPEMELWHFGDADPKGFDILRDLRERTGRKIGSLHMEFRPSDRGTPLEAEDRKTITRLLGSHHLTADEKNALKLMEEADDKGDFEQESLGRPSPCWPFYPAARSPA